jgi:hypothetical protein
MMIEELVKQEEFHSKVATESPRKMLDMSGTSTFVICLTRILTWELLVLMGKLVAAEETLTNSKLTFFFL